MGLPPGGVTAEHLDPPRTAQLRALGNGVMPQQAANALRLLLEDLTHVACSWRSSAGATPRVSDHRGRTARASTTATHPAATRTAATKRTRRTGTGSRR
jgi:hypothetical protein